MRPAHDLVTIAGDVYVSGASIEEWSFGLRCFELIPSDVAIKTAAASSVASAVFTHLGPILSNRLRLKNVTVARINALGRYEKTVDGAYDKGEWNGATVLTNAATGNLPLQSAVVVSLMTARAGATGRGRIFSPAISENLGADGRLTGSRSLDIANNYKAFLNAVNALTTLGNVGVHSSKGYASSVTGIRVGKVVDTLRSRRRSQPEDYSVVTLV
jgi:hypothetical protein